MNLAGESTLHACSGTITWTQCPKQLRRQARRASPGRCRHRLESAIGFAESVVGIAGMARAGAQLSLGHLELAGQRPDEVPGFNIPSETITSSAHHWLVTAPPDARMTSAESPGQILLSSSSRAHHLCRCAVSDWPTY